MHPRLIVSEPSFRTNGLSVSTQSLTVFPFRLFQVFLQEMAWAFKFRSLLRISIANNFWPVLIVFEIHSGNPQILSCNPSYLLSAPLSVYYHTKVNMLIRQPRTLTSNRTFVKSGRYTDTGFNGCWKLSQKVHLLSCYLTFLKCAAAFFCRCAPWSIGLAFVHVAV